MEIPIEKFKLENKREEINPYMTGKLLRKKYESAGYNVIKCDNFETSLLVEFARRYSFVDKYMKVKLGEYRKDQKEEEYIKQVLSFLKMEDVEKLLFACRMCSYLGDPSFPDFMISKDGQVGLRYVYSGDELLTGKILFTMVSKSLEIHDIKFCSLDFLDFSSPDILNLKSEKTLSEIIQILSKKINLDSSAQDIGIDMSFLKISSGQINSDEIQKSFNLFISKASENSKLKEDLLKLESLNPESLLPGKPKPEKLAILREKLGVNMMEAIDLLNLHEILKR